MMNRCDHPCDHLSDHTAQTAPSHQQYKALMLPSKHTAICNFWLLTMSKQLATHPYAALCHVPVPCVLPDCDDHGADLI